MSGWTADNDHAPPPAGPTWTGAPAAGPTGPPEAPEPAAPAAWAVPEAPTAEPAWATPEAGGAAMGPATEPPPPPAPGWDDSPEPVTPPVLPVALKAMTTTDIVDGAWGIIKARPKTVFAVTAMILLPTEIVAAWLSQGGSTFLDLSAALADSTVAASSPSVLGGAGVYLAALIQNLSLFLLGGAIARLVSSWYAGGDMTARQAVLASLRKAPALLGAFAILLPVKLVALAWTPFWSNPDGTTTAAWK